jgi:periplasmic copper chaperone A
MKKTIIALILFFALAQFSFAQDNIVISDAWVREVPPGTSMSAGYMTIENKATNDDKLIGISSDVAESAELHISKVDENGVATMEMIKILDLPSGEAIELKPGGMHIMLIGLKESLVGKDSVKLNLNFEKSGEVKVEAPVKSSGSPAGRHHH